MTTVSTDHARHSSGATLADAISSGTMTAGDAGAIAAQYQSPGGHGAVFATFASGMATDAADLLAAIDYESAHPAFANDVEARAELDALGYWVRCAIVAADVRESYPDMTDYEALYHVVDTIGLAEIAGDDVLAESYRYVLRMGGHQG